MPNIAKYIMWAVAAAAIIFLVWYFGNIVAYVLISAVLAILGKPLVDRLVRIKGKKWCMPRWIAALVTLVTMWTLFVLFMNFFIPLIFNKIHEISGMDMGIVKQAFSGPLQSVHEFLERVFSIKEDELSIIDQLTGRIMGLLNLDAINHALSSVVSLVGSTLVALFSITFITFFFLKEENLFRNIMVAMFPKKYEDNVIHALDSVTNLLIRYFSGIVAESTIIMLLLSTVLMIIGFTAETAFFMGTIMGVLNVIPYIGPLIGGIICVIVGIISPLWGLGAGEMILIVGGTIIGVKLVDDFVLQPVLYSNMVKAHPLEIFIVILLAGSMAGIPGMLLAIPSYTVLRVFAKEFFNHLRLVQKLTKNI